MFDSLRISSTRAETVIDEITAGSEPQLRFYALLIASAMIACFGLAANSTAVIIGAMLVSPLMMPIFGIALGMLQGDLGLLGKSLVAEIGGAILAVGSAYLVGMIELTVGEATPEMLSRTQPNLIDLLVAVFAGFAGVYALLDARVSPALPGVAIATAIVPPLSTCGLCLSMGAWSGAGGALLLFMANFVSILIVAIVAFAVSGLARPIHRQSWRTFGRRFGPIVMAFVVVSTVLTNSLIHIVRERSLRSSIRVALEYQLDKDYSTELEEFKQSTQNGRVQVLATVRSPHILRPARVSEMQASIRESLHNKPVDLVVRTVLAKDVTPKGSFLRVHRPDLDGSFLAEGPTGTAASEALAEQIIRERFESEPGFELTNVEYGRASRGNGLVLAFVNTIRRLRGAEIKSIENELRKRFEDPQLMFLMRVNSAELEFSEGPVRVEWTNWQDATDEDIARFPQYKQTIFKTISTLLDATPIHVHFNMQKGAKRVLVEVVGPEPIMPEDVGLIQNRLTTEFDFPIEINLWHRSDFVVNAKGFTTYKQLTEPDLANRRHLLRELFDPIDEH